MTLHLNPILRSFSLPLYCLTAILLVSTSLIGCGNRHSTAATLVQTPLQATTEEPAWIAALIEADKERGVFDPQTVTDSQGNDLAVWEEFDGTRYHIWAKRRVAGQDWSKPSAIDAENAGDAYHPRIGLDAQGNALVVWQQFDGTRSSIHTNRYDARRGWGSAAPIESSIGNASKPQLAVDAKGHAVAVWQQTDGTRLSIRASRYDVRIGWGKVTQIENLGAVGSASAPQVAVDGNGNAMAVWNQFDGSQTSIWFNRYAPGMGWAKANRLETQRADAHNPQVTLDSKNSAIVMWQQFNRQNTHIWANRYVADAGWGKAQLVKRNNSDSDYPTVAIDGYGNAYIDLQKPHAVDQKTLAYTQTRVSLSGD